MELKQGVIIVEEHHRRSIRLQHYNYAQNGAYFVTICTHERAELFGQIAENVTQLNKLGGTVAECWQQIPAHFPHVELDEFVVMPNHIHGILVIGGDVGARHAVPLQSEGFWKPVTGSLPTIIRSFKSAASKRINEFSTDRNNHIWQRNYHEHVIRSEVSLNAIRQYVQENPARWEDDTENPARIQR